MAVQCSAVQCQARVAPAKLDGEDSRTVLGTSLEDEDEDDQLTQMIFGLSRICF